MLDFPSDNLQIGQTFPAQPLWVWDGEKWTPMPRVLFDTMAEPPDDGRVYGRSAGEWVDVHYQKTVFVFASSGTFDPATDIPKLCRAIKVTCTGGGGGGGGGSWDGANYYWGVGGAGGGTAMSIILVRDLGTDPIPVTVGAGGAGGLFGGVGIAIGHQQNGAPGGTTSFGSFLSATGGGAGPAVAATQQQSGPAGDGVGGQLNFPGAGCTRWHGLVNWPYLVSEGGQAGAGMGASHAFHGTWNGLPYGGAGMCGYHSYGLAPNGAGGVCVVEIL